MKTLIKCQLSVQSLRKHRNKQRKNSVFLIFSVHNKNEYCYVSHPSKNIRLHVLYAVLHARFEIREYFLNTSVKEVYDNVGQVLNLVRIQLSLLEAPGNQVKVDTAMPKHLVTQSIRDLRFVCKQLYSDVMIMDGETWAQGIEYTIKTLNFKNKRPIKLPGELDRMQPELRVLLFRSIQEILFSIKDQKYIFCTMQVNYTRSSIIIDVLYSGSLIDYDGLSQATEAKNNLYIKLIDRLRLMNTGLQLHKLKGGKARIRLDAPINLQLYE